MKSDLLTKQLGKSGLLGLVSIFASVIVFLYYTTQKTNKERLDDKDKQLDKLENRAEKTDSINHKLYEINGAKKIIDSLK